MLNDLVKFLMSELLLLLNSDFEEEEEQDIYYYKNEIIGRYFAYHE